MVTASIASTRRNKPLNCSNDSCPTPSRSTSSKLGRRNSLASWLWLAPRQATTAPPTRLPSILQRPPARSPALRSPLPSQTRLAAPSRRRAQRPVQVATEEAEAAGPAAEAVEEGVEAGEKELLLAGCHVFRTATPGYRVAIR